MLHVRFRGHAPPGGIVRIDLVLPEHVAVDLRPHKEDGIGVDATND
jgi:hypothetical protein